MVGNASPQSGGPVLGFTVWRAAVFLLYATILFFSLSAQTQANAPGKVQLGIIEVSSREQAERVLNELKQGADFAALAKKESIDAIADQGGYMGEVAVATLRLEMRNALANLKPGDVSEPVKTPLGYAILRV